MIEKLQEWAAQRGYRVAWGSASLVESAKRQILERKSSLQLDERFFDHELKSVIGKGNANVHGSIVLIAIPRPAHRVHFDLDGKIFDALLPPTYFRYRATFEDIRMDLFRNALPGVQLDYLNGPLKAIANRLGLVRYGRNNISYAERLGSYIQLCGYLAEVAVPQTETTGESLLPQCKSCSSCISVCPTDAILEDRVLLRAERCLTFLNENSGGWPDWLNPRAHNCLLGCLECQQVCPANPDLPIQDTGLVFSAAETRLLLSEKLSTDDRAETGIRAKMAWLGQPYSEPVLGRNLRALLHAKSLM